METRKFSFWLRSVIILTPFQCYMYCLWLLMVTTKKKMQFGGPELDCSTVEFMSCGAHTLIGGNGKRKKYMFDRKVKISEALILGIYHSGTLRMSRAHRLCLVKKHACVHILCIDIFLCCIIWKKYIFVSKTKGQIFCELDNEVSIKSAITHSFAVRNAVYEACFHYRSIIDIFHTNSNSILSHNSALP